MTEAIFFDLDGTLTDPKLGITRCIQYALEQTGLEPPEADRLTWCIGPPLLESLESLVGAALAPSALVAYRQRFSDVGWSENTPYEGIDGILAELEEAGMRLYVATSKPHVYAQRILEHFGLRRFFTGVYGAELDGTRSSKTELLRHALADTRQVDAASMVGDREHDVIGALANGMKTVGVSYGYGSVRELTEAGAHHIVDSPTLLIRHFLG